MSTSQDLKEIFNRARPLVEQWLGIADQFAELRAYARTKELDWAQIKTLLKAHIQDEADNGDRVQKLIEKADLSCAYADMLGLAKIEKNISREAETTVTLSVGDKVSGQIPLGTFTKLADAAKTPAGRAVVNAAIAAVSEPHPLDIPAYLART